MQNILQRGIFWSIWGPITKRWGWLVDDQFCGDLTITASQRFPGAIFVFQGNSLQMFLFFSIFFLYNYLLVTVPSQLQLAWTSWSFCIADGVGCSLRCLWLPKCPILLSCDRIITNIFHRCTENMKCMYWRLEFIHEQYVPLFLNGLFGFANYQHSCIKAAIHPSIQNINKQDLSEYIPFYAVVWMHTEYQDLLWHPCQILSEYYTYI